MSDIEPNQAQQPHIPVMLRECLEGLDIRKGHVYIDGTFGAGGHSQTILDAGGSVLGIDRDEGARAFANTLTIPPGQTFTFTPGNFRHLDQHAKTADLFPVAGILLDLGVSSMQLDEAERGFAFRQDGPLDMRMGGEGESAAEVVNTYPQDELAAIIFKYGEERHSRRIARRIVEVREQTPFETTEQLADVIASAYPNKGYRREHPARRTFQALRIFVNDELGALEDALAAAERALAPGGRLVVLSYHSLEDRIVKHFVKGSAALTPLTKRPLTASEEEVDENPRARSAKLRIAVRNLDSDNDSKDDNSNTSDSNSDQSDSNSSGSNNNDLSPTFTETL